MRALNTLSTVGATVLALGDAEFIKAGQRVLIAAVDSVATCTMIAKFNGVSVFEGPLPIEPGTDRIEWPGNLATSFRADANGQLSIVLGGTVAGARVNILILAANESLPW